MTGISLGPLSARGDNKMMVLFGLCAFATILAISAHLGNRTQITAAMDDLEAQEIALAQAVDALIITDNFERPEPGPLGLNNPPKAFWAALGTGFEVSDGVATAVGSPFGSEDVGSVNVALIDTGWNDVAVSTTVEQMVSGSGVVFRFQDLQNYWSVIAVPEFATWNLVLTLDGQTAEVWSAGLSNTQPGAVVQVVAIGDQVEVFVDGDLRISVERSSLSQSTPAGLIALGGSQGSFSNFTAIRSDALAAAE